jgi:glucokinase
LVTEAGHIGFAPENHVQREILEVLSRHYGRISNERVASGMGVENIYQALGTGESPQRANAAAIFERARDGEVLANQALGIFFEILGQVAGDVVLSMGAFDGVYVAGGVAQRYPDAISASRFREGFENKGRHGDLMKLVPSQLIVHPQPGLLGAAAVARRM